MGSDVVKATRSLIAWGLLAAGLTGLNRWQTPPRGPWAEAGAHGVIVGSSQVWYALDAALLDSLSGWPSGSWTNRSMQGLSGAALLSEACAWVEAWPEGTGGMLVLECLAPEESGRVDWRLAGQIPAADFTRHAFASLPPLRASRSALEHGLMRATRGLHATLHPLADVPSAPPRRNRIWRGDSARVAELRMYEDRLRRVLSGEAPPPAYPAFLVNRLVAKCAQRGIELVPVIPAASPAPFLAPAAFKRPPVVLDGGMLPTPFSTPEYLCDPMHLNERGARRVTLEFWNQLAR